MLRPNLSKRPSGMCCGRGGHRGSAGGSGCLGHIGHDFVQGVPIGRWGCLVTLTPALLREQHYIIYNVYIHIYRYPQIYVICLSVYYIHCTFFPTGPNETTLTQLDFGPLRRAFGAGFKADSYQVGTKMNLQGEPTVRISQVGAREPGRRLFIGSGIGGTGMQCGVDVGFIVDNIYETRKRYEKMVQLQSLKIGFRTFLEQSKNLIIV